MQKFLLSILLVISCLAVKAQVSQADDQLARQLVSKNLSQIGISQQDLQESLVSSTYLASSGFRMVYLQQSYKGIPVYNKMHVLAFRGEQVVSVAGDRIPGLSKSVNIPSGESVITVEAAVVSALKKHKLDAKGITAAKELMIGVYDNKFNFGKLGVATENITAELIWMPVEKGGVRLAWQILLVPARSDDYLLVRIDAENSQFINEDNLTVYDSWDHAKADNQMFNNRNFVTARVEKTENNLKYNPPLINSASYLVVNYPAESPIHAGGTAALDTDPWNRAPGNATSLKWHSNGTTDYNITRGNNVWATEDRAASNTNSGLPATSSTPDPLTFNFTPDYTAAPTTATFQQYAITNLFYWNNIMHDLNYVYGFDEVGGNFQANNQGRGGAGNDDVIALAQSGAGTNNANFATPNDGSRPRMRMYLFTAPNPDRDGDLDNGVVTHEYGHGISNRLTGGPANSSCLGNAEQGGEGWSDYFALMLTTNWATAQVTDGAVPRAMGTYVLNQAVSGSGIRTYRYSTNMAVNPLTYANLGVAPIGTEVHNIGEVWCMALWEMTWEIIKQTNTVNPDLFNASGAGGNSVAMKLVIEGMRLQVCNPGFLDARNAILKADTLFFGAQYSCSIWKAFAKRGMGRNAIQGSSGSATDQVAGYIVDNGTFRVTESVPTVPQGQNVTYTNFVQAGVCSPMTNFYITDTLPTNVTYVSGGTYNAGNRTITFGPVNLSNNANATYPFTVTVNNGTYFAPLQPLNEPVAGSTVPASWFASPATGNAWTVVNTASQSAPNAFFAPNPTVQAEEILSSITYTLNPASVSNYTTLSFWHSFNTEPGWDGGVVEISTDGGSVWTDLGSKMISGKYNGGLGTGSALANRQAFTGFISGFMQTVVNLSAYAGQTVQIRFRFASDNNTAPAGGGWWVDDVVINSEPAVVIKSNLFDAGNILQNTSDTLTRITSVIICIPADVATQPASVNACSGANASFSVTASGTAPVYQWQVNTGSGFADLTNSAPYSGVTTATLNITGVTVGMNAYQYRCVVSNTCNPGTNSNAAGLTVGATATLNSSPSNSTVCANGSATFTVSATSATSYQWQVNTGSGFSDIAAAAPYSGVTTATLTINPVSAAMNNYQYRCVLGSCPTNINSNAATLTVNVAPAITASPLNVGICSGVNTSFSITASGNITSYQWQLSTDGGGTYSNISGANANTYSITNVAASQNNYRYRCVVTGPCGAVTSGAAILTVNPTTDFTFGNLPAVLCLSDPALTLQVSVAGGVWTGNGITSGVFNPVAAAVGTTAITYTYTNSFGCVSSHNSTAQVNECPERHRLLNAQGALIVYPVPNDGHFNIRMNSDLYKKLGIKVFASDGRLVHSQEAAGISYGSVIKVNISRYPSGTYRLYLYNNEGKLITRKASVITFIQ